MSTAYPPTIDPVKATASGFTQSVTGTKIEGLYVFCRNNGGAWTEATYPNGISGSRWSSSVSLVSGSNVIGCSSSVTNSLDQSMSNQSSVTVNLFLSKPETYNVWNNFDEFGLLLGLPRIPAENNSEYKARLFDVYKKPANSTYQGLMNGVSRELGIPIEDMEIVSLSSTLDRTSINSLLNADGNAIGTKLIGYANDVYDHNPIFWGNVISDESYWDGVDEQTNGYSFLPHIWDPMASGIYDKWQTAGIGDQDDLWVDGPVEVWNEAIGANSWYLKIHSGYFYSPYPSGAFS
jgi:hypothetical protein